MVVARLLKKQFTYDSVEIISENEIPVYIFNNLHINKNLSDVADLSLAGTWSMVAEGGMNYGHLIKEAFGSFLYSKKIVPESKALFMNAYGRENQSENQNVLHILEYLYDRIRHEFGPDFYEIGNIEIHHRHVFIEKLVIVMDNAHIFFEKEYVFNDVVAPHLSLLLVKYFNNFMQVDEHKPKKIFITRKAVSKELKEKNKHELPYYNSRYFEEWVENSIENCFIKNGYVVIDVNGMTIQEQISYFYNATHIGGIVGCALVNSIFVKDFTTFYAVRPNNMHQPEWHIDAKFINKNINFEYLDPWECKTYQEIYDFIEDRIYI